MPPKNDGKAKSSSSKGNKADSQDQDQDQDQSSSSSREIANLRKRLNEKSAKLRELEDELKSEEEFSKEMNIKLEEERQSHQATKDLLVQSEVQVDHLTAKAIQDGKEIKDLEGNLFLQKGKNFIMSTGLEMSHLAKDEIYEKLCISFKELDEFKGTIQELGARCADLGKAYQKERDENSALTKSLEAQSGRKSDKAILSRIGRLVQDNTTTLDRKELESSHKSHDGLSETLGTIFDTITASISSIDIRSSVTNEEPASVQSYTLDLKANFRIAHPGGRVIIKRNFITIDPNSPSNQANFKMVPKSTNPDDYKLVSLSRSQASSDEEQGPSGEIQGLSGAGRSSPFSDAGSESENDSPSQRTPAKQQRLSNFCMN